MDNYYNILGVHENATADEIKKAYRKLQMKYHPDKNPGDNESKHMTQKINEAYETLRDDKKKMEYDMFRNNSFMRMNSHGPHNMDNMDIPINDIFNMMFGGPKIHVFHMNKPIPIIQSLTITMEQVYNGASVPLEIERWILEDGIKVFEKETIYVDIPKGIDENELIILRDKGNVINDNCRGDIKISIVVINTSNFKRNGLDLLLEKTISLKEALTGFSFELNHINGKSYILINNKGSIVPSGYKKIYKKMGLIRGNHTGDLVIQFNVEFPDKLTTEQIDKLIEIL